MKKNELWLRLKAYNFEHIVPAHLLDTVNELFGGERASKRAFVAKLSKKLGWTTEFTKKALIEYRKFVYLGLTADFSVTPSKFIDQVWHEHILFSKAYRAFCEEVICHNFDHNPELVPMTDQTGTFNAQYLETIELYKEEFGVEPPEDVWGKTKFDTRKIDNVDDYESRKKKKNSDSSASSDNSLPLYMYFGTDPQNNPNHPEFSGYGGGHFGGGGASSVWENNSNNNNDMGQSNYSNHSPSPTETVFDTVVSDSISSCSSGSSCGSSCGGGGE